MKLRVLLIGAAVGVASVLLLGEVAAQDGEGGMGFQPPAWMKLTKEHKQFEKSVGEWEYTMKWSMAPGAPPWEGKGKTSAKLLWNGLFLEEESKGSMSWGGQKSDYEARLILGYDTITKEYVSIWLDSSSPIMSIGRGTEKNGAVTLYGEEPEYMNPAGIKKKVKLVVRHVNKDKRTFTSYDVKPGGDVKTGEIVYTRVKKG